MKKIVIFLVILMISGITGAQAPLTLDQQLVNVNQSSVTSGIIYERVAQFANLYNFNKSNEFNVADFKYFKQAFSEMRRASNDTKFISLDDFKNLINETTAVNQVDIAIINTQFHILNYNKDEPTLGGLTYNSVTQKYNQIIGKAPFYQMDNTIISTTKDYVIGNSIIYKLRNDLFFTNGNKTIKSLVVNFGDGINRLLISNGVLTNLYIQVNYESGGEKTSIYTITYNDNTTLKTNSKIYIQFNDRFSPLELSSLSSISNCSTSDPLREDFSLQADIPFTDFISGDKTIKSKINYRILYSNGNIQKKIIKPIIIIDGFDPGDKRKIDDCDCEIDPDCASKYITNGQFDPSKYNSMVDMMVYKDNLELNKNLLTDFRSLGYDIIIVNHPTYTTTNLQNGQSITIDGGAYFIESNAMALVKLISSIRNQLIVNGSPNQIAVVGPSMGGQVSRYALAYMEKNNIPHNVYLWISIDSPHLGANIPLGDQGLINLLKEESESAKDFYNNQLASPASKEQLIEFHQQGSSYFHVEQANLNGQTITQGLPANSGNAYFQAHYNNQNNNGLPGSHGFPVNLRKISLVNGSVTGKTFGSNSENVLTIKAFERVHIQISLFLKYSFSVHLSTLEVDFMPETNYSGQISYFNKAGKTKSTVCANFNQRGNMDIIPGGYFSSQNDLNKAITGVGVFQTRGSFWQYTMDNLTYFITSLNGSGGYWETREFKPIHSFIPTFSAIAHKQPNQYWGNRLDRNLVCSDETYFDSYFGHDENTQHTSFDYESVNWLKKELAGNPQAPHFPIQSGLIMGAEGVCDGISKTYTIDESCKVPSPVIYNDQNGTLVNGWSVEGNLQITASTAYSVNIQGTSNEASKGKIIATFQNGQSIEREIYIGVPIIDPSNYNIYGVYGWYYAGIANNAEANVLIPVTTNSYKWTIEVADPNFAPNCPNTNSSLAKFTTNGSTVSINNNAECYTTNPKVNINWGNCTASYILRVFAINECGGNNFLDTAVTVSTSSPCFPDDSDTFFSVNPNPVRNKTLIVKIDEDQVPCDPPLSINKNAIYDNTKAVKIYDLQGNLKYSNSFNTNQNIIINDIDLDRGHYILNVRSSSGQNHSEIIIVE
ncbi:hypothetical protein OX284_007635 [Flavobacterium sp. SUN046]|uniref:PGAP1-like alpha/beta domain-containing protein n=1 Tax=Flavobacterium sp. SUN046 TaxID=3002440 RepID=UPI002DBD0300|nr:hypothetical protein [Flavobacterium sp. SUN046]MEC4049298.1 hypothetical protein [Flavobacterium sp. SUN046]